MPFACRNDVLGLHSHYVCAMCVCGAGGTRDITGLTDITGNGDVPVLLLLVPVNSSLSYLCHNISTYVTNYSSNYHLLDKSDGVW